MASRGDRENYKKVIKCIIKHKDKRAELKAKLKDKTLSFAEKMRLQILLDKMPRNSSMSRYHKRCIISGASMGLRRGISRWDLRELASYNFIPGMKRVG